MSPPAGRARPRDGSATPRGPPPSGAAPGRPGVDALLAVLGSLADPTRLRLLALLDAHELGVADLCDALRLPQSTVSRHLKVLSDESWLTSRRDGTAHLYRMSEALDAAARRLWKVARAETAAWAAAEGDAERLAHRLASRRAQADAFFAGAAAEWEKLRAELYGSGYAGDALLALVSPQLVVADLGCGTGDLTARLARHVRRVIGVDRSVSMLRAARRRLEGLRNVELHRADLEALPLEDACCDAALLVLALTYAPDPAAVLEEAARVLRPAGTLVVTDLARHGDELFRRRMGQVTAGFEPATMTALLVRAGLEAPRCDPVPPQPGARGPALLTARATKPGADTPRSVPRTGARRSVHHPPDRR